MVKLQVLCKFKAVKTFNIFFHKFENNNQVALDMTLNCILVYDSITERFFRTPGPRTKYLSAFVFRSINNMFKNVKLVVYLISASKTVFFKQFKNKQF